MDSDKFDKLAKALTNDTTRRGVLGGLAGILASVVGAGSTEARKRAQGGKGAKKCRHEGHPCEGNQKCCGKLDCRVTGPGNAKRCAQPVCPEHKCDGRTCTCKYHGDCATGCCKNGYCSPKWKCAPKSPPPPPKSPPPPPPPPKSPPPPPGKCYKSEGPNGGCKGACSKAGCKGYECNDICNPACKGNGPGHPCPDESYCKPYAKHFNRCRR